MYLDPGTGSIVLQVILAVFLGAGVVVRVFWRKIKSLFVKSQPEVGQNENGADNYAKLE